MRFFFHAIGNGHDHRDPDGEELTSSAEAIEHGKQVAHELRGSFQGSAISVTDQSGNELARLPIRARRA